MYQTSLLGMALLATTVAAQNHVPHLMMTVRGDAGSDNFGSALAFAGDVDKDGCDDLIVGARFDDNKGTNSGMARVYSGRDGKILYSFDGDSAGDNFGWVVAPAGDVNRDGYDDVVVGAPYDDNKALNAGMARVFSGKDGKILYTFDGATATENFGYSVHGAGDVNLDGYADVIVGAPRYADANKGANTGRAFVFSGKDGSVLRTYIGDAGGDRFGHSVTGMFDANRDVFGDFAVSALLGNARTGRVKVYSGLFGNLLYTFNGDAVGDQFGTWVSFAGDVNKDGHGDVVVGAPYGRSRAGYGRVFSGKDGKVIWTLTGVGGQGWTVGGGSDVDNDGYDDLITGPAFAAAPGDCMVFSGRTGKKILGFQGYQVAGGGDVNGDGFDDVFSGTWLLNGIAWVYSGKALSLRSNTHFVPKSFGGTQNLSMFCGVANANRNYWIFGSITGPKPGITLTGVHIPLNPDPYTDLCMGLVNLNPPYNKFRGKLDSQGNASASFIVPSNLPTSFSLYHAAVIYDNSGTIHFATNAASIRVR